MYKEHYQKAKEQLEQMQKAMLVQMANRIQKYNQVIVIGNMEYYLVNDNELNNMIVPAYKYLHEHTAFEPIYDVTGNEEYGWKEFESVCRIFDVIDKFLLEKGF